MCYDFYCSIQYWITQLVTCGLQQYVNNLLQFMHLQNLYLNVLRTAKSTRVKIFSNDVRSHNRSNLQLTSFILREKKNPIKERAKCVFDQMARNVNSEGNYYGTLDQSKKYNQRHQLKVCNLFIFGGGATKMLTHFDFIKIEHISIFAFNNVSTMVHCQVSYWSGWVN